MDYKLKNKIVVTEELLSELEAKGWQEIEYLQMQLNNLAEDAKIDKLRQLIKNLLTSYYVFTGSIEMLAGEYNAAASTQVDLQKANLVSDDLPVQKYVVAEQATDELDVENDSIFDERTEVSEPFEYFVDFDEPNGDPISDKDLYGN